MTKSLSIIVGSTRTNRVGRDIAEWVSEQASAVGFDNVTLLDLKEIALPRFDTPLPPMYAAVDTPEAKAWAAKIAEAEHVLIVTPEYNRSIPASVKTALDYISAEWKDKPLGIVSYGYMDGGANAAKHLHEILSFLKTDILDESANIQLGETTVIDGKFTSTGTTEDDVAAVKSVLTALASK